MPLWAPLVFVVRGSIVDAIRAHQSSAQDKAPFEMLRHPLAKWLVAGRFMRGFYAAIKGIVFCWLLLIHPLHELVPVFWEHWGGVLRLIGDVLIWVTVCCVWRVACRSSLSSWPNRTSNRLQATVTNEARAV